MKNKFWFIFVIMKKLITTLVFGFCFLCLNISISANIVNILPFINSPVLQNDTTKRVNYSLINFQLQLQTPRDTTKSNQKR